MAASRSSHSAPQPSQRTSDTWRATKFAGALWWRSDARSEGTVHLQDQALDQLARLRLKLDLLPVRCVPPRAAPLARDRAASAEPVGHHLADKLLRHRQRLERPVVF